MIRELLLSALKEEYKKQRHYIGISQMPYCARKVYLERKNKKRFSLNTIGKFEGGKAVHKSFEELLKKHKIDKILASEKKVSKQTKEGVLQGHLDIAVMVGQDIYVFDYKTIDEQQFEKIDKPRGHNVWQVSTYAEFVKNNFKHINYENLYAGLLYVNRRNINQQKEFVLLGGQEIPEKKKEFGVEYIESKPYSYYANKSIAKYEMIKKHLKNGTLPPKRYDDPNDSWECKYCDYSYDCWDKRIKINKKKTVEIKNEQLMREFREAYIAYKKAEERYNKVKVAIKKYSRATKAKKLECPYFSSSWIDGSKRYEIDYDEAKVKLDKETLNELTILRKQRGYYRVNPRTSKLKEE